MDKITKEKIGQRINAALALRDKKQKELAKAIGVADNAVSYYCNGDRVPNYEQLIAIAQYLEVSADYLLGLSNEPTTDKEKQFVCDYTGLSEVVIDCLRLEATNQLAAHIGKVTNELCLSPKAQEFYSALYFYLLSDTAKIKSSDIFAPGINPEMSTYEEGIAYSVRESKGDTITETTHYQKLDSKFMESVLMVVVENTLRNIKSDINTEK